MSLFPLIVNAACDSDATITVEVLDADSGEPISGFGRGDCSAIGDRRSAKRRRVETWRPLAGSRQRQDSLSVLASGPGCRVWSTTVRFRLRCLRQSMTI